MQKYADYVNEERDFPLREFRFRHGDASMAVGYNKSLFFFHDLRQRFGEEVFYKALRCFYVAQQFSTASWEDLRGHFEATVGHDVRLLFNQWLEREGAPLLSASGLKASNENGQYRLTGVLIQVQDAAVFKLLVPLRVMMDSAPGIKIGPLQTHIAMDHRRAMIDLLLPAKPLRLEVDPDYDLFRRLHPEELPPSLGQVFGSEKITATHRHGTGNS